MAKVFKDYGSVIPSSGEKPFKPSREGQNSYMINGSKLQGGFKDSRPGSMEKQGGPERKAPAITKGTKV